MGDERITTGSVLGETYRIERVLGRGGMATVFEASHVRLPRRFAIKVIKADAEEGQEFLVRFRREAETLAKLDHPNIVNVFDWNVTESGLPYLVMELLQGEDLSQLLRREGALPLPLAIHLFAQIAAALEVAHSHGIVHRDVKPSNVFLCESGPVDHFVKVLDFGIAKHVLSTASLLTQDRSLLGTPAYMSPEQARGDNLVIDERSDQFALALILYEMLAGKPAFYRQGEPVFATLFRVISEQPPPLPDPLLNQVISRALDKQPEARFPSLADFVAAVVNSCNQSLDLPILPKRTLQTGLVQALLTDPSISPDQLLPSHNTRRAGEIFPNVKTASSWGVRLLSSVGGVTILLANGSFRRVDPSSHHAVSASSGPVTEALHDVAALPAPSPDVNRASVNPSQSPDMAGSKAEADPQPTSIPQGPQSASADASVSPDKDLTHAKTSKSGGRADAARFELTAGFPKGSIGEQYVLGCLLRERRVAWSQLRNRPLRFEGSQELRLLTPMAEAPKAALEQCLRGIVLEVMMVPSVIEVRVK
jgi:serine/threonine protein kinase